MGAAVSFAVDDGVVDDFCVHASVCCKRVQRARRTSGRNSFPQPSTRKWTVPPDRVAGTDDECWADSAATTIVIYYDSTAAALQVSLPPATTYSVQGYDVTNGGVWQEGSVATASAEQGDIGTAPLSSSDWVVLLQCTDCSGRLTVREQSGSIKPLVG